MHKYGYQPDQRDFRDLEVADQATQLPSKVDLRATGHLAPVYDQGQLGSCTANALAAAFDYDRHKQGKPFLTPSRLFIYWNERSIEGTTGSDAGAAIRDGVKVLKVVGTPQEVLWPYVISTFKTKPVAKAFTQALTNEALVYKRVTRTLGVMKTVLASGLPFVAGISVYESFESSAVAANGIVPMPLKSESLLGGHAILVVGYDDTTARFICRNSWGSKWGDSGYFYLPYSYLLNTGLSSDMWVIETVETPVDAAA